MDTEIVLLGMCQSHALKAVRLAQLLDVEADNAVGDVDVGAVVEHVEGAGRKTLWNAGKRTMEKANANPVMGLDRG